ncbi:hypothetical protein GCM10022295_27410 [Streptomyces osmaniensis]|uniref:Tc toxin complex TcA C-terminal TcB-binding domain-containing protein n=1 Tax=Streptomyces osmaniensis TaxID=593134 RepID=A0ABP6VZP8_9ACTN|nr:hypothetical protein KJK32_43985 [Streptomyces sp. JCM17656]
MDGLAATQSIVTSGGIEDFGLFDCQSDADERYRFGEGFGAISRWRLELTADFRQFDYASITDVVVHLRYTARDGGRRLTEAVRSAQRADLAALMKTADGRGGFARAFNLRQELADWHRLTAATGDHEIALRIADRFPFVFRAGSLTIGEAGVCMKATDRLTGGQADEFRKAAFDGTALTGLSGWLRRPDVLQTVVAMPEAGWDPANVKTLALSQVDPAMLPTIDDIWLLCQHTFAMKRQGR